MKLSEINIYPIKSCKGISLKTNHVESLGFKNDRRFMLVDDNFQMLTQREYPMMAGIEVMDLHLENNISMSISHPDLDSLIKISIDNKSLNFQNVNVWTTSFNTKLFESPQLDPLSELLGIRCKLAVMDEEVHRPMKPDGLVGDVSFADALPFLVIGKASLDFLNTKLETPVEMNRFRPNIVVDGSEPHQEDGWEIIKIGNIRFKLTRPCVRCVMTTVNPQNYSKSKEPLRTLNNYRNFDGDVQFGMNAIALDIGEITLGDQVQILK